MKSALISTLSETDLDGLRKKIAAGIETETNRDLILSESFVYNAAAPETTSMISFVIAA